MFEEQLEHRLYAERRGGMRAAYLLLGVDRFRVIIESTGPTAGDSLLQALASRLRELLQREEGGAEAVLYRMDGDRFAVFLPGFATGQAPMRLAEHLLAGLHAPFYALGREYHLSVSIGISIYPLDGQDAQTLERNAETAMQRVKQQGGASFECYTPRDERTRRRVAGARKPAAARRDARRVADALSAAAGACRRPAGRRRGADPLATPGARAAGPGPVHAAGRGVGADRADRRLGAAYRLRAGCGVAPFRSQRIHAWR
ncbi:MAG: GGDEF domain-containing protein [Chromatiales bacterium]|nr:GGDEF domain-containing protein [Chromatiales bacterium]